MICLHSEIWSFKIESSSTWTPYAFNLYKRLSCQTLSNALYISKKTPLTLAVGFSSNAVCISGIIERNWTIHESPGWKPDWEDAKSYKIGWKENCKSLFPKSYQKLETI